ncbi:Receptor-like protein kinase HERK 1 [Gossypium arboreum]|uniref:Receptor-like protein kinase HERK 1 n=1 Tax=Gossypium arboreum TaxID=29729 RepID=A0A0B0MSY4_GOSAR|nr:Receptor-like protein kinase HERK 1 [Gossypium arboreum]
MYYQSSQSHLCLYLLGVISSDAQDKESLQLDLIDDIVVFQPTKDMFRFVY